MDQKTTAPTTPAYVDHVGLWENELKAWVPQTIFDAHVHLGPAHVMGQLSPQRRQLPLSTFSSLPWEQLQDWHRRLFSGKRIAGLIAFPFPLQEADLDAANRYLIERMKRQPTLKGFALAHPTDTDRTLASLQAATDEGVRF